MVKKPPDATPSCIFCGGGPVTEEHLLGKWLHKKFAHPSTAKHTIMSAGYDQAYKLLNVVEITRNGVATSTRIRGPCRSCNNIWMSALESKCGPILWDMICERSALLDQDQQISLARWIVLKSLIQDATGLNPIFTPEERDQFRLTRDPPSDFQIWIGRSEFEPGKCRFNRFVCVLTPTFQIGGIVDGVVQPSVAYLEATVDASNAQQNTFVLGPVLAIAISSKVIGPELEFSGFLRSRLQQIWPLRHKTIRWPIELTLNRRQTTEIVDILKNLTPGFPPD